MKRQSCTLAAIASTLSLVGLIGSDVPALSQESRAAIKLTTDPPIDQAVPFKQPVRLSLAVVDAKGNTVKNAKVQLQIQTPASNPWFTTDFPIVEGTKLLNLEVVTPDGKLDLQQVFPIRGTYKFVVTATPLTPKAFEPVQQTLELTVPENPAKYRNLLILAILLLGVGWFGGQVIGRQSPLQAGEIAPQPVRLLLSGAIGVAIVALLVINVSAERSESHNHNSEAHNHNVDVAKNVGEAEHKHPPGSEHDHHHHTDSSGNSTLDGNLKLAGDEATTVGQLANLSVQAVDAKGQPRTDVYFGIKTIQLEDNEVTFAYQAPANQSGQLIWQQQFFDGAPHSIEVTAMPQPGASNQFKPTTVSRSIEVEAVAPPLSTRLISLTYFTSLLGFGMGLGLWQQHRKLKNQVL